MPRMNRRKHLGQLALKRSRVVPVPRVNNAINQANPLVSMAAGVPRSQVHEFNQLYRENGITGAYHLPNGDCVFESRQARNQVLNLRDARDNDACYGDHSGK